MYKIIKPSYAYGYYQVGNNTYINKTDALIQATKTKQSVHWNFHDTEYGAIDWTVRPQGHLLDLYRIRAQQLRDQYDYIVIHFSGGADSWTVLNSFLSNNIPVDEVYTRWARAERKYTVSNCSDFRECNLSSEYEYAVEPVLRQLEKKFPQTRIHVDDYSDAYTQEVTEQTLLHGSHYTTMGTFHRFNRKSPGEIAAATAGKRVAVIYGFDKVQCALIDGVFSAYFIDRFGSTDLDPERTVEGFYWTPHMPEIPVMQAHDMKLYYESCADQIQYTRCIDRARQSYVKICYPEYNLQTFQVNKPIGSNLWASEAWINLYNPRYVESWKWALGQFTSNIDPMYYDFFGNKLKLGYKTVPSHMYQLGTFASPEITNFNFTH
jgi:hypothetical protein